MFENGVRCFGSRLSVRFRQGSPEHKPFRVVSEAAFLFNFIEQAK